MQFLDLTLPEPALNLALDEALVEAVEEQGPVAETLRIWQPAGPLVVVGRSSKAAEEVDLERCAALDVPVLRRISGGAAIVAGSGCLMYAVALSYDERPALRAIDQAHAFVLGKLVAALRTLGHHVESAGTSDVALAGRKVSGNSLRCLRRSLLYHGTLLYDCSLELVGRLLRTPPRQPAYRAGRTHAEFVTNLPASREDLTCALRCAWQADAALSQPPLERAERLAVEKYRTAAWNRRL